MNQMSPEYVGRKVTVITTNEFFGNVNVYEGKLIGFGFSPYAQYSNAPFVDFTPTRKRKGIRIRKTYKPFLMVLDGVGHNLKPDDDVVIHEDSKVKITQSKYASFDPRHISDFTAMLESRNIKPLFSVVPPTDFL